MDKKYSYDHNTNDESEVSITVKVEDELFSSEKNSVLSKLAGNVNLKGFRPGKAPQNLVEAHLGATLYEETLNRILPKVTQEIIDEMKFEPITRVDYEIKKVGQGAGVEYVAKFTVYPTIKLGNFSKIKIKKEEVKVEKEEIEKVLTSMFEDSKKKESKKAVDSKEEDKKEDTKVALDDEWVKSLKMENISTVDELKKQVETSIKGQKEMRAEEEYFANILKEAVKSSTLKVPAKLLDLELEVQESNYKERIEKLGLKVDDFLRNQKTSMEELRESWKKDLEEKLQVDLMLTQVIREQKFKITDEEVDAEIKKISDEKLREQYNSYRGKMQVQSIMLKQKAFNWLKEQVK